MSSVIINEQADTPANKPTRRVEILAASALVLLLALYGLFLWSRFAPAISDPDANGYWAQGSLLFTTGRTWLVPESDSQYVGMHWLVTPSGRYYSRYPPGLAVLVGVVYKLLGYKASVWVNPALAVLTLLGLYFLIRRVIHPGWAVVGTATLAMNPTFNHHALACDSHMAVTFCLVWGLVLLLRWSQNGKLWEIFTAGVFLGAIPTIRYAEALFALGIGLFLLWQWRSHPRIWIHYLAASVGAAIPIVPLLIRNQLAFGAFWRTAYALTKEQTGFGWQYFKQHFVYYIHLLTGEGVGIFFALGVVGMVLMCGTRRWRPMGVLLGLLTIPITFLYMSYYWTSGGMATATMRFLIPTFVCYTVAGVWSLAQVTAQYSAAFRVAVVLVVLLVHASWGAISSLTDTRRLHYEKVVLARITDALEQNIQRDDIVMAPQQILQHLDFVRYWRLAELPMTRGSPGFDRFRDRQFDQDAPSPRQLERVRIQEEKYRGLTLAEREKKIAGDVIKWAGGHKVYYVGTERDLQEMQGECFNRRYFQIIAKVSLPEAPPLQERGGFMGGMRFRFPADANRPGAPAGGPPDAAPGPPPPPGVGPPPAGLPDGAGPFGFRGGRRFRGMGGGMFGLGFLAGEKEVVIAKWIYTPPSSPEKGR